MKIQSTSWLSTSVRALRAPRAAVRRRGAGENASLVRGEQARLLLAHSRLLSPIGLAAAAAMPLELPPCRTGTGALCCALLALLYAAWLVVGLGHARMGDGRFLRLSVLLRLALGICWGALLLVLARAVADFHGDPLPLAGVVMALVSTAMITTPFLAAFAFWLPVTLAAAAALRLMVTPVDEKLLLVFGAYAAFTFSGLVVTSRASRARIVERVSLARGQAAITALLGEGRNGAAGWTWQTDADGNLTEASPQFATVLGLPPEALQHRSLGGLIGRAADPEARNAETIRVLAARTGFRDLAVTANVGGETRWWSLSGDPQDDQGVFTGFRGIGTDITERRRADAHMHALATRDSLTGIANRQALLDALDTACAQARTGAPGTNFALVLIDLDRFKDVNDRYGHAMGDELLKSVAQRMRHTVRGEDRVARLGGDEFAIMLARAGETEASEIVGRLAAAFADCVKLDARTASVGATFGVALCPRHGTEPAQLLRNADLALYDGKRRERGSLAVFRRELETAAETRQTMQEGLRNAIDRDEVRLLFRPTIWTATGTAVSAEPLATWSTPGGATLSSLSLFRLAAEGQLLAPFTHALLGRALAAAVTWDPQLRLTFGLPVPLLSAPMLVEELAAMLLASPLPMHRVELAFRAQDLAGASDGSAEQIAILRRAGARLVLDEFGTGTLDLSLFRRFGFDAIRLHGRLLRELPDNASAGGVLRWILALAHELGMDLIADGVANPDQLAKLRQLGVGLARGRAIHDVAAMRYPMREPSSNLRPVTNGARNDMLAAVQSLLGGI